MRESVKNYLALASGLTELTRERAVSAAEALVAQGEAARDQVSALAEELLVSSKSNREAIAALVRVEVDRTMTRLGAAKTDDVSALFRTVESALRETAAKAADAVHELAVGMGLSEHAEARSSGTALTPKAGVAAKQAAHKTAAGVPAQPAQAASPATAAQPAKSVAAKAAKKAAAKPAKPAAAKRVAAQPAKAAKPAKPAKAAKPAKPAKAAKPAKPAPR